MKTFIATVPATRNSQLNAAIEGHLAMIPAADRKVLYLRFAKRRTAAEICAEMKIPLAAVERVLCRARAIEPNVRA